MKEQGGSRHAQFSEIKKLNWSISKSVSVKNITAKPELFSVQSTKVNSSISEFFYPVIPPEVMQVFIADHYKHVFVGNAKQHTSPPDGFCLVIFSKINSTQDFTLIAPHNCSEQWRLRGSDDQRCYVWAGSHLIREPQTSIRKFLSLICFSHFACNPAVLPWYMRICFSLDQSSGLKACC